MFVYSFSDIIDMIAVGFLILMILVLLLGYIAILIKDKLKNIKKNKADKKDGD